MARLRLPFRRGPAGRLPRDVPRDPGRRRRHQLAVFIAARFYNKWWRFTSIRDLQAIVIAVVIASILITAVLSFWQPVHRDSGRAVPVPRGILVLDFFMTLSLVGGARFAVRSLMERPSRSDLVERKGRRVLICGAGDAGNIMLREMQRNRSFGYTPVGIVDDDTRKAGLRVQGVRVLGTRAELPSILRDTAVDEVIIAMPSAPGAVRREITDACRAVGVPCKTLPGLPSSSREVTVRMLRDVSVEDLPAARRCGSVRARVAVPQRQVRAHHRRGRFHRIRARPASAPRRPAKLVMVDHAENNLFEIDRQVSARGRVIRSSRTSATRRWAHHHRALSVGDLPRGRLHVPMMELNPLEAIANNAIATAQLALADRLGVQRSVAISTDKAVEPKTVMGCDQGVRRAHHQSRGGGSSTKSRPSDSETLGSSGIGGPDLPPADRGRGPVTVTDRQIDPLLHDHPRGGAARHRGHRNRRRRGHLRPTWRARRIMDLAENMIRLPGTSPAGHLHRGGRHPAGREAPRGSST